MASPPREVIIPDNALSRTLEAMNPMGGGPPQMGPPPSPSFDDPANMPAAQMTQEQMRAHVDATWGPAGTPVEQPPAPAVAQQAVVSPAEPPLPQVPFLMIDMVRFKVITGDGKEFPINDMGLKKHLMILCRDTVWFATNDEFIAMSAKYGLELPVVPGQQPQQQQEATNAGDAGVPPVPPPEAVAEVPVEEKEVQKMPTTRRRGNK